MAKSQLIPPLVRQLNVALEKYLRVTVNGQPWRVAGVETVEHDDYRDIIRITLIAYPLKPRKKT